MLKLFFGQKQKISYNVKSVVEPNFRKGKLGYD
jgi:hypothetical protein